MNYIDQLAVAIHAEAEPRTPLPAGEMLLYRIYALLALSLGTETAAQDVHDAWAVWASERRPEHQSLVPFADLTPDVQVLDEPYVRAIHVVACRRPVGAV